jgi:hypothetical protein
MDTILLAVTVVSLVMVAAMSAVLMRMMRVERRRSDARVALLRELAAEPGPRHEPADTFGAGTDYDLRFAPEHDGPELFHERAEPSPWPRRLAVAVTIAATVTIGVMGWSSITPDVPSTEGNAGPAAVQPLELMSLSHTHDRGSFTVEGLVRNPRGGSPLSRVEATVLVFGPDGTLQANGRAPLDIVTLSPGEESPFVIRVAVSGLPARYRVGFREENDRPLSHIDRRDPEAIARKQEP